MINLKHVYDLLQMFPDTPFPIRFIDDTDIGNGDDIIRLVGADCWGFVIKRPNGSETILYDEYETGLTTDDADRTFICYNKDKLLDLLNIGDTVIIYMFGKNSWSAHFTKTETDVFVKKCFASTGYLNFPWKIKDDFVLIQ